MDGYKNIALAMSGRQLTVHPAVLGALTALAAALALIALGTTGGGDSAETSVTPSDKAARQDSVIADTRVEEPCPHARHVDPPTGALQKAALHLSRTRKVDEMWFCGSTPIVRYGAVAVDVEDGWGRVDIAAKWKRNVAEQGGYVSTIAGFPAYVYPAVQEGSRNAVYVAVGNAMVTLFAERDTPIDDLVELAKTLSY